MTAELLKREDAPAALKSYSVTLWQATGRADIDQLNALEGFVMDMVGPTLNHLTHAELVKAAREAEAFMVATGELPGFHIVQHGQLGPVFLKTNLCWTLEETLSQRFATRAAADLAFREAAVNGKRGHFAAARVEYVGQTAGL